MPHSGVLSWLYRRPGHGIPICGRNRCPPQAASISSKLAEFDERMRMAEESGSLFDMNDDVTEVAEDVGASIV